MSDSKSANFSPRTRRKSFDFEDDMTYENFVREEFPSDIVFPQTLNLYLGRKIQEMTSENGCLRKALQDAEEKLQVLENSIAFKTSQLSETENEKKSTKIVLLSQMCKEKTIEVKCRSLDEKRVNTEAQLNYGKYKNSINNKGSIDPSQNDNINLRDQLLKKNVQIKACNEKVNHANVKIYELKNTDLSLKQEIIKSQKVLPCRCSYQKSFLDSKAAENLRNLERERRQQVENSARQLRESEIALENTKRKLEAAKARIKVLENELCTTKRNVILLNEKKCHDDQLIEALNGQLKAIELRFLGREVEIQNQKGKFERECAAMKNELEGAHVQNNQLRRRLEEREKEIKILKNPYDEKLEGTTIIR